MFDRKKEEILCESCVDKDYCKFHQTGGRKTECYTYEREVFDKSCFNCKYGKFFADDDGVINGGKCECFGKPVYASDCCTEFEEVQND